MAEDETERIKGLQQLEHLDREFESGVGKNACSICECKEPCAQIREDSDKKSVTYRPAFFYFKFISEKSAGARGNVIG
jgi:hypothetical protein